jgi:hypothetical protein
MECRDARPLIARINTLAEAERVWLRQHLHGCTACRDEIENGFIVPSHLPLATPPSGLEVRIMSRLPVASPIALAQRRRRNLGILRGGLVAVPVLAMIVGLGGLAELQFGTIRAADLVQGIALPLALAAKALLVAVAQSWLALLLALSVIVAPLLLRRFRRLSAPAWSPRVTLAGGALAAALLVVNIVGSRGDLGTITSSLNISQPVAGDVTSLVGDIVVDSDIAGDVIALAGTVILQEGGHVHGSVFAGEGAPGEAGLVDQQTYDVPKDVPSLLATVYPSNTDLSLTSGTVARLGGLLAALATLLLGILLVVIRPDAAAWGSRQLMRFPGRALVLGMLTSAGLIVLALGGSVVLAATVAGVLLVPLLLLLLHLPYVAGVATVGYTIGHRLTGSPASTSAIWGIGLQLVLLLALGLTIPMIGLLIFYVLGAAGLGGTLLGWQSTRLQIE